MGEPCSVFGQPVCDHANSEVSCDLEDIGCESSTLYAVNFSSGATISVFGVCPYRVGGVLQQEDFSCFISDTSVKAVDIRGSAVSDELLSFHFEQAGLATKDLTSPGSQTLTATLHGAAGNDDILGSDSTANNYTERLEGGQGTDDIDGRDGDDLILGGQGNDELYGGDGEDLLHGGFGNDLLFGGADSDGLLGARGIDEMRGEGGDDYLCETNANEISGPACVEDYFYGGTGFNRAWMDNLSNVGGLICPNKPVYGNGAIQLARPDIWDWEDPTDPVLAGNGTVQSDTKAWTKCTTLLGYGW